MAKQVAYETIQRIEITRVTYRRREYGAMLQKVFGFSPQV